MKSESRNETHLRAGLDADPKDADAHAALGLLLLEKAQTQGGELSAQSAQEATLHLRDAVLQGNMRGNVVVSFLRVLLTFERIPSDPDLAEACFLALTAETLGAFAYRPFALNVLNKLGSPGSFEQATGLARAGQRDALRSFIQSGVLRDSLAHPVSTTILKNGLITLPELEFLFAEIRRNFLQHASNQTFQNIDLRDRTACYALADQCFLNEYAFWENLEETIWCDVLADSISADLISNVTIDPFSVAILACYRPLSSFSWSEQLAETAAIDDEFFADLLVRHIKNPKLEKQIAQELPEVAKITNDISSAVKQLYEENPYFKWVITSPIPRSRPFRDLVRERLPTADQRYLSGLSKPRILVAGCGTGQSVVHTIRELENYEITAIDISRSSLAYAKRQLSSMEVQKPDFMVCDILDLPLLNRKFDIIECSGVLHHMAEPFEGLRVLAEALEAGGVMTLALYSSIARTAISAVQEYAAAKYQPTLDGIRRFRRDALNTARKPQAMLDPEGRSLRSIVELLDFYSTSMCRDMIFHVQEHQVSIAEIEESLNSLGLRFLGFKHIDEGIFEKYRRKFPNDPDWTNFKHWTEFEIENPSSFLGMYHFVVQKPLL